MKKKLVNWSFSGPTSGSHTTGSFEVPYETTDEEIREMVEVELESVFSWGYEVEEIE